FGEHRACFVALTCFAARLSSRALHRLGECKPVARWHFCKRSLARALLPRLDACGTSCRARQISGRMANPGSAVPCTSDVSTPERESVHQVVGSQAKACWPR